VSVGGKIAVMESSTDNDETWAQLRRKQADHCLRRAEHTVAQANYLASLSHDPEKLDSVYRLVREYAHEGKLERAFEELQKGEKLFL
jgi:hypothetical protein